MNRPPWEVLVSNIVNSALYGIGVFVLGFAQHKVQACQWAIVMFGATWIYSTLVLLSYQKPSATLAGLCAGAYFSTICVGLAAAIAILI